MIKFSNHLIIYATNIETKEKLFELSYWYTSDAYPNISGKRIQGYFKSIEEARNRFYEDEINGLL